MAYRIGIDLGTNSIGWCLLKTDEKGEPRGIIDAGVRLISPNQEAGRDPQKGTSLAVDRRNARSARRRRDRFLLRRKDLMAALIDHGLMPVDEKERKALESLDPYELRAIGLDEKLSLHELGRALFHLHQRRGFKSNRIADAEDNERGPVKEGIRKLRQAIDESDSRTYGEFLAKRHAEREPVRARNVSDKANKAAYDFYPARALVEEEFDALWAAQAGHHAGLTEAAREEIRKNFFRQRPLKPVNPGKCTLNPDEPRAPWALPLAQRFRILQDIGNLEIARPGAPQRKLSLEQRDLLYRKLLNTGAPAFKTLRKLLKLEPDEYFNLESERRQKLKGDETAAVLAHKDRFGPPWRKLSLERQQEIVETLLGEQREGKIIPWLIGECGRDEKQAEAVSAARLPQGYCRLGRTALAKIVAAFESGSAEAADPETGEVYTAPLTYDQAVRAAGYHHSDLDRRGEDELLDRLPYYGDALARHVVENHDAPHGTQEHRGRITNPTVHIGLNQLRRTLNAMIAEYGRPAEIVVELSRDLKLSKDRKDEISKQQTANQKANEARIAKLKEIGIETPSGLDLLKMRLWEELDPDDAANRRCPYSGEQIGLRRLFSSEVEVEHILPFRRTLDNSPANKTVSLRRANRLKGNQTPYEAFGESPPGFEWGEIAMRAGELPKNKRWRFQPDAMERFEGREKDFLDRQLVDTQYLSRIAKTYLGLVCPANRVWVIPGRLTHLLRRNWRLNKLLPDHNWAEIGDAKNRKDHRHHAIDAFVVACTRRGLLQRVARAADENRKGLIADMPEPFPGFDYDELHRIINGIIVSHRPDHGRAGKLHEETAYGLIKNPDDWGGYNLVYRKPFATLNEKEAGRIRDPDLRRRVEEHLGQAKEHGIPHKEALAEFAKHEGIRRVRLLKKEKDLVTIADADGRPYKAYAPGDNHRVEIFEMPDGEWRGEGVTVFDANREDFAPRWREEHPEARLVMRVHKGDLLALEHEGREQVMIVKRLDVRAGRFKLAGHAVSGNMDQRHSDPDDPFRWLMASYNTLRRAGARKVRVDELGRVWNVSEKP